MSDKTQKLCMCQNLDREENENQREWMKRIMCMFHWMQTDYYKGKFKPKDYDRIDTPKIYD